MHVTRVTDATGTHVEPELNPSWDELTKLQWHAAVVAHDTGLPIGVHPHIDKQSRITYGLTVGDVREGGRTSLAAGPYRDAWDALSLISIGAEALLRMQNHARA